MRGNPTSAIVHSLWTIFIWTVPLATSIHAAPIEGSRGIVSNIATNTVKPAAISTKNPSWIELSPAQQQALAPLSTDWDKFDIVRKKKWLEIGNKFPKMTPDEQQRVQERMREWIKLTPEQRHLVRENYARAKKLNPTQKTTQWQNYQQLPEEQKKKLANEAAAKKRVANLPTSPQNIGKTMHTTKSKSSAALSAPVQKIDQPPLQTPVERPKK
jgi:hypothetical protein